MTDSHYGQVVVGGTFDHIHRGHESLLGCSFGLGKRVVIGVSSDSFLSDVDKHVDHDYDLRLDRLKSFLKKRGWLRRCRIVKLEDRYGPALDVESEAIVVSEETERFADECNLIRYAMGRSPLSKIVTPTVLAEDGDRISSTRIRSKEIDLRGRLLY
ncbi:MAG: phosphopantetheine adenylyltransferase [Nitrososphaeria archaeon]